MAEIPAPNSKDFYDQLSALRTEAFTASGTLGRASIGKLVSFGRARAEWTNEKGGPAILTERGLRIGNGAPIGLMYPTRLHLVDSYEDPHGPTEYRLTSFRLELDEAGLVEVHTKTVESYGTMDLLSLALDGTWDALTSRKEPTIDQKARLLCELERGATGSFR